MNEENEEITAGSLSFLCLFTSLFPPIFSTLRNSASQTPPLSPLGVIGPHGVGCATRALYSGMQACLSEALSTCARG